jgi:peptidoglycan/xylan/chitin deacetylase (PgdA/CDA1 family)
VWDLRRLTVAAAAVVVGTSVAGQVLVHATEPEPGSPAAQRKPAAASPAPPEVRAAPAAALTKPVTGRGRPPLPRTGRGPFGTHRSTGAEYVALTFDDGPDPRWTPRVLELLRRHRVKATFCVVGELVAAYPKLVREIAADGHTLCNHSWNHDMALGSRSRAEIRRDLERTDAAIRTAAPGHSVSYYRQPGGAWTRRVVAVAAELGMSSLHWAVDPQDWARPGAGAIADEITATTRRGAIVLLHDGGGERDGTVDALRRLLPAMADRFRLAALPPEADPPPRHGDQARPGSGQR